MRLELTKSAAVLALASPLAALAANVVYQGTLHNAAPADGSAGGFTWFLDDGAGVEYWQFTLPAGGAVATLAVDRLNANFDPGLSLYAGTTNADTSLFSSTGDWGGLTYIGSLDDENPPHLASGPNGDPFGSFTLAAGSYTVAVGGSLSTDAGSYPYRITLTVPEPAPAVLLTIGVAGLGMLRRWRRPLPQGTPGCG